VIIWTSSLVKALLLFYQHSTQTTLNPKQTDHLFLINKIPISIILFSNSQKLAISPFLNKQKISNVCKSQSPNLIELHPLPDPALILGFIIYFLLKLKNFILKVYLSNINNQNGVLLLSFCLFPSGRVLIKLFQKG